MEKKEFLDYEKMYDEVFAILTDSLDDDERERFYDITEDYAHHLTAGFVRDMDKYVHMKDTQLIGNFCNICEDWDITTGFIKSEVTPWGNFRDMVKSVDDGTISDEDLAKVQEWCQDWFFTAFGTFGISHNFTCLISDLEYEEKMEEEYA